MGLYTELTTGLQAKGWTDGLTPDQIARERIAQSMSRARFLLAMAHDIQRTINRRLVKGG